MKELTITTMETMMDFIDLHSPDKYVTFMENNIFVNRDYVNKMIVLTGSNYDNVRTFLINYYGVIYEQPINDMITYRK